MFGLMRSQGCGSAALAWQQHYCGTCKSLGRRYGWRSRPLLNFDTVFLAEWLDAVAGEPGATWSPALAPRRCWQLPAAGDIPFSLGYAAAVTLLLTEAKLQDRRQDGGGWHWQTLTAAYRRAFAAARRDLAAWGLPVGYLLQLLAGQVSRERITLTQGRDWSLTERLAWVAEPTARVTAMVMAHGTLHVGRHDLYPVAWDVGHRFGSLIYELDALEDYAVDRARGHFNPLAVDTAAPATLAPTALQAQQARLWQQLSDLQAALAKAPLPTTQRAAFPARLRANLAARPVMMGSSATDSTPKKPRRDRRKYCDSCDCCDCCDCCGVRRCFGSGRSSEGCDCNPCDGDGCCDCG